MAKVTVSKLDNTYRDGDWHDKPLRWKVEGPDGEIQKFPTRDDAKLYARIRRKSENSNEAMKVYARC